MPRPASQPVTPATTPRQELGRARLLVGAAVAAVGLFVALHWIVLPGSALSLDQKSRRTESVAALEQSGQAAGSRRNAAANRVSGTRAATKQATAVKARRGHSSKATPGAAGKPVGPSPGTKRPEAPAADEPAGSAGESSGSTEMPPANQDSPPPPPPPPPSPPPPPVGLPQLPQVPEVPKIPDPTVPEVPTPTVPSVPIPQVPTLP